jgi:hypothetical protein
MKKPPLSPPPAPRAFDEVYARSDRDRQRVQQAAGQFRRRWDDAAAEAGKGNDEPYRLLADALRKLLRS